MNVVTLIECWIKQPALPDADREMPAPVALPRAGARMQRAKDDMLNLAVLGEACRLHPYRTRVGIAKVSQGAGERI